MQAVDGSRWLRSGPVRRDRTPICCGRAGFRSTVISRSGSAIPCGPSGSTTYSGVNGPELVDGIAVMRRSAAADRVQFLDERSRRNVTPAMPAARASSWSTWTRTPAAPIRTCVDTHGQKSPCSFPRTQTSADSGPFAGAVALAYLRWRPLRSAFMGGSPESGAV